ncbi:MAG: helix-turn-helix domain-containing protein [Clostridia bacterium]|nr:helix-turn-helix domain-containing protein [Clostridia bacterium]
MTQDGNVCMFIPYRKDYFALHTVNFVLETAAEDAARCDSVYKMHYVFTGKGRIRLYDEEYELSAGDVFFTFPSATYQILSDEGFSYMYISFIGARGNMLLDSFKISTRKFIFRNFSEVGDFWRKGLDTGSDFIDIMSESILLYTFSVIGASIFPERYSTARGESFSNIKKFLDDNFTSSDMSLTYLGKALGYNPKYISTIFKKNLHIGFSAYLNMIRIQYACTLIEQGHTTVTDISYLSGYTDSHYFSRVFKKEMGISPLTYINHIGRQGGAIKGGLIKNNTPSSS